jgi:hypothetical protein
MNEVAKTTEEKFSHFSFSGQENKQLESKRQTLLLIN